MCIFLFSLHMQPNNSEMLWKWLLKIQWMKKWMRFYHTRDLNSLIKGVLFYMEWVCLWGQPYWDHMNTTPITSVMPDTFYSLLHTAKMIWSIKSRQHVFPLLKPIPPSFFKLYKNNVDKIFQNDLNWNDLYSQFDST